MNSPDRLDSAELTGRYLAYIAAFNARDFSALRGHLAPDLHFEWDGLMPDFRSASAMVDFYREAWKHVDEHLTIHATRVEGQVLTATLTNRLHVRHSWPDSPLPSLTTAGAPFELSGAMRYAFREGKIARISEGDAGSL